MVNPNSTVIVTDASGAEYEAIALTGVVLEDKIPVVWVRVSQATGYGTGDIPWPPGDVRATDA